jgi:hypothetical protein
MRSGWTDRNIVVSDIDLDSFFNPWHRESRAYEHIDDHIKGPARSLFLEYYGTAKAPYSSCPDTWRLKFPDTAMCVLLFLIYLRKRRRLVPVRHYFGGAGALVFP